MIISIIVAVANNWVIGKNNSLPWHLPADLKHFKDITTGHAVLMGQTTHESIGKILSNRLNIVLSNDDKYKSKGCVVVHSPEEGVKTAEKNAESELFIIGGASVYKQMLKKADKLYLTMIHHNFDGDVFFPKLDFSKWSKISETKNEPDEKNLYPYDFIVFKKRKV